MAPHMQPLILGVLLQATLVTCQEKASIKSDFGSVVVLPDAQTHIICRFDGPYSDELIEWQRNGEPIWRQSLKDRKGDFLNDYRMRYDMLTQLQEGEWEMKLVIKRVTESELGTFSCKYITTDAGEPKINVFVYGCLKPQEVSLGNNGSLKCLVRGTDAQTPYPNVDWTGDQVAPTPKQAVLNFNASMELMGKTETCEISAPRMETVNCTATYDIKKPYTHRGITSIPTKDGNGVLLESTEVVQLNCNINGEVEPRFSWLVNNRVSEETKRILMLNTTTYLNHEGTPEQLFNVQCSAVGVQNYTVPAAPAYSFMLRDYDNDDTAPPPTDAAASMANSVFLVMCSAIVAVIMLL